MSVEANKALAREYIEQGVARVIRGDQQAMHKYLHDHFVNHTPLTHDADAKGAGAMTEQYAQLGEAFPDVHGGPDFIFAEGDMVAVHWTALGVHSGTMRHRHAGKVEPSGRAFEITGLTVFRITDGKIAEMWTYDSHLDYLVQIGELQPKLP
jgi:predicted SnoaL-like aldol condensation-catalyzing enzyme